MSLKSLQWILSIQLEKSHSDKRRQTRCIHPTTNGVELETSTVSQNKNNNNNKGRFPRKTSKFKEIK